MSDFFGVDAKSSPERERRREGFTLSPKSFELGRIAPEIYNLMLRSRIVDSGVKRLGNLADTQEDIPTEPALNQYRPAPAEKYTDPKTLGFNGEMVSNQRQYEPVVGIDSVHDNAMGAIGNTPLNTSPAGQSSPTDRETLARVQLSNLYKQLGQ